MPPMEKVGDGRVALAASPGERAVLRLIRERGALTRGDIGGLTG
jgi:hypothetical protein